jgi:hypothetical protein
LGREAGAARAALGSSSQGPPALESEIWNLEFGIWNPECGIESHSGERNAVFGRIKTIRAPIGSSVGSPRAPGTASVLTAAAVVTVEMWLVWSGRTSMVGLRAIPPTLALMTGSRW